MVTHSSSFLSSLLFFSSGSKQIELGMIIKCLVDAHHSTVGAVALTNQAGRPSDQPGWLPDIPRLRLPVEAAAQLTQKIIALRKKESITYTASHR